MEVVSWLERDGRPVFRDLRWGVYVVLEAPSEYVARLLQAIRAEDRCGGPLRGDVQALSSDRAGTGHLDPVRGAAWRADRPPPVSAATPSSVAKRDLRAGETLDGEGGYTVWGKLMPAAASLAVGALPIGLAHRVKLKNDVAHGAVVRWSDVEVDAGNDTIKTRRAMEAKFRGKG